MAISKHVLVSLTRLHKEKDLKYQRVRTNTHMHVSIQYADSNRSHTDSACSSSALIDKTKKAGVVSAYKVSRSRCVGCPLEPRILL